MASVIGIFVVATATVGLLLVLRSLIFFFKISLVSGFSVKTTCLCSPLVSNTHSIYEHGLRCLCIF